MSTNETIEARLKKLSNGLKGLTHTFNFILGAMMSIREARRLGHKDRADYDESDRTGHLNRFHRAINAVNDGQAPDNDWMAGFYYNAAMMRIDACHERFLKAVLEAVGEDPEKVTTNSNEQKTDALARKVEQVLLLAPLSREHLKWTRREVNNLKHQIFGHQPHHVKDRPDSSDIDNATAAIEELLILIENDQIQAKLREEFSDTPPA